MVKIRLTRMGAHKRPFYRIVVTDARAPRDGAHLEILGFYNPLTQPSTVKVNPDRALAWLNQGAQPTEAVARILKHSGVEHALVQVPIHESKKSPKSAKSDS